MSFINFPCPTCKESMTWVDCPDDCGTGFVEDIKDGKMVGMKDCPTCIARGHRRMGGQLVCRCGYKEVINLQG